VPNYNRILNLPGFTIKKVTGYQPMLIDVYYKRIPRCAHCAGKRVRKKSSFHRTVKHESVGYRLIYLRFKAYKLYCHDCRRYGNQRFPGIPKYQRATDRLKAEIFYEHTRGVSQQDLAKQFKLGKATVERWYHRYYQRENKEISNQSCPTVLGIDEHFFTRKQGYATTLCDLRKHRIFDIVKGRSEHDLSDYLTKLANKEKVKVVCMDLSSTYRAIVKKYFPNAKIVADRFHVIRLLQHQCMMTYRQLSERVKNNRGILAVLRTRPTNLSPAKLKKRDQFLTEHPAIKAIYEFQQELHTLLREKTQTKRQCRGLIPKLLDMIKQLKESPFKQLVTLGKTLFHWREAIACMWRFSKNNGITEGFHRKMKLIQRRAYGFRNFDNYRTRVRVLCC
jgi:transposase